MTLDATVWRRLIVAGCFLVAAGVAYSVYALRIDEIRVTGLRTLDPHTVIRASGLRGGERILWIRLTAVQRRVEHLPAVASVMVDRSLPQTVVINVRERTPLARLDGHAELAVDGDGRVFASDVPTRLPTFAGWRGRAAAGATLDDYSRFALDAYREFPGVLRARIVRIVVDRNLTMWLDNGTEVRFGALFDLVVKARVAVAVLEAERWRPLEYIDVRAPSVPVSKRRAPATPTPTLAPAPSRQPAATPATTPAPTPAATPAKTPAAPSPTPSR